MTDSENKTKDPSQDTNNGEKDSKDAKTSQEIGGRKGPEPTRYGDWENNGIASDF